MSTTAKTGNIDMATKAGNNYISETLTDRVYIPTPNSGFSMMTSSAKDLPNDGDKDLLLKIARLAPKTSILPFPVVGRCHNYPGSVSSGSKNPRFAV